jgi:RTX calcium-binding nonapeptide repeat (4 copies)
MLVLVAGSVFTSVQASTHDHSTHDHSHLDLPAVAGLERARPGSRCAEVGYEVDIRGPGKFCSHGPDPAPAGVDLGDRVATSEITDSITSASSATFPCVDGDDGTSGLRVEAIYARADSTPDRYTAVVDALRTSALEDVQDVVTNSSGDARSVRFVTEPATGGGCQVVVHNEELSEFGDDDIYGMVDELRALGYNRHDRKYLVWMDVPAGGTGGPEICGLGAMAVDETEGTWNANNGRPDMAGGQMARIDTACWGSVLPNTETPVEAHELFHTLGAVQANSPNSTANPSNPPGAHCTDNYDVMCYDDDGYDDGVFNDLTDGMAGDEPMTIDCADLANERLLDCGNDDYFSLNPAPGSYLANNWNTANSSFLVGGRDLCTREGTPANDVMTGTSGIDVFCGLEGNDVIKARNKDIVFGGPGSDTLDMSLYTTPITAIMEFGNAGVVDEVGYFVNPVAFHTDVENIRGTSKDDFLVGNNLANKLFGGGGKDSIIGGGGNDQLIGEGGDDQMQVDAGNDKFVGGPGFDFFAMQMATQGMTVDLAAGTASGMGADKLSGVESMFGSSFPDILKGNGVFNFMMGGGGGDVMYGRAGGDHMYGESGNDKLYGDGGYDYLRGDTGRDVCKVGPGGGNVTGCP